MYMYILCNSNFIFTNLFYLKKKERADTEGCAFIFTQRTYTIGEHTSRVTERVKKNPKFTESNTLLNETDGRYPPSVKDLLHLQRFHWPDQLRLAKKGRCIPGIVNKLLRTYSRMLDQHYSPQILCSEEKLLTFHEIIEAIQKNDFFQGVGPQQFTLTVAPHFAAK